jgi:hypothetical protein
MSPYDSSGAFAPIKDPVVNSDSVGTASKLLCPDHPGNLPYGKRRLRIYNTHAVGVLGVFFCDRGDDVTSGVFAQSVQIAPGREWPAIIDDAHRILIIGNIPGVTYNFMMDDI